MTTFMPHMQLLMVGASVRGVPLPLLAHELGMNLEETRMFCERFGVAVEQVNGCDTCDLAALELAWHTKMNPALFREARDTGTPITDVISTIAQMYAGSGRAALLERLNTLGKSVVPDIRRHKTFRQSSRGHRARRGTQFRAPHQKSV